jgi:hypothetical protein
MRKILMSHVEIDRALFITIIFYSICIVVILCSSCETSKQAAIKKSEKEYQATLAHAQLLYETRQAYPCDTSTVYVHTIDTATLFATDTLLRNDTLVITKYKTINTNTDHVIKVLDNVRIAGLMDSIKITNVLLIQCGSNISDLEKQNIKLLAENSFIKANDGKWKRWCLIGGGSILVLLGIGIAGKIYKFI